jgi:hypothetical protein
MPHTWSKFGVAMVHVSNRENGDAPDAVTFQTTLVVPLVLSLFLNRDASMVASYTIVQA